LKIFNHRLIQQPGDQQESYMLMRNKIYWFLFIFPFISLSSTGQDLSNKGKEFYVGYGHHQFFETGTNSQQMVLYLSAEQAATVTITITGTTFSQTYNVPANSVIPTSPIPKIGADDARLFDGGTSEGIFNRAIRISSNVPIVAYSHIYGTASSGASMLMPTNTWGYQYQSINAKQSYATNCFSWFFVVAKENNTLVEITPSVPTRGGRPANVPFTVTLNKGQIYQVLGANSGGSTGFEMTGTRVRSIANAQGECHPIAAFSGSSRTFNPSPCLTSNDVSGGGDNNMQQLFPSQAWGKKYLLAPTSQSTTASSYQVNRYKIVVSDPNTVVKRGPVTLPQSSLINNTYYTFESLSAQLITADKPIMIAQLLNGSSQCLGSGVGDPEMIIVSPVEQGIKRIGFYRNHLENITSNYLTMVIPQGGLSSLTIDGQPFPAGVSHSYDHPSETGYKIVIKRWTASAANSGQSIVKSDSAFTAITYGFGSVESYGYNAGTLINNLNVIGTVYNTPDTTVNLHPFTCKNTPVEISMKVSYAPTRMEWQLSQVPQISPNTNVVVNNPVPVATSVIDGITYYQYTLPGTYSFSDTGTYVIPVKNFHPSIENCNNTEVVTFGIEVRPTPIIDFSFIHSGCVRDSVKFSTPLLTQNNYNISSWRWVFEDASSLPGSNPVKLFSAPGDQVVQLLAVTQQGCLGDTSKTITLHPPPVTNFEASVASICEGTSVNFNATSSYGGPGSLSNWYWNFGNGSVVNTTSNSPQSTLFPTYGTYTVKQVVKVSEFCISDTATRIINVYAKPIPGFSFSQGCLPSDGIVLFTNSTTVPDGQAINYSWNFGDTNASSNNPNTSSLASPTHNYSLGTYTINLSATTANGCSRDTSITTTFNVSPNLLFAPLNAVCESVSGTISVATGSVTNGVTGTSTYKGPGTSANGNFSPSAAGAGTHTIWYVFSSNGGCKDSLNTTITVYPKPISNFTVTSVCLGETTMFTDASSIISGNITNWNWNFGDGNTAINNNGAAFSRSYSASNSYTVKLVTVSDQNCVSDTAVRTLAIHPIPQPNFTMPAAICMPNGNAVFTNTSTIAGNGTMNYSWNFGDGSATSTANNPSHVYSTSGPFNIRLTATSNNGCTKDTTRILSAFFEKPVAIFQVTPKELCQGSNNIFTDQSYAPNSTVNSWSWTFGDGTNSTTTNPTKQYNQAGNYIITLTVNNAAGCTSDPFRDTVKVFVQPVVDAGPSFVVLEGTTITFNPTVNDSSSVNFLWTPSADFTNPSLLRPSIIASYDQTYTLTATSDGNCTASDVLTVKILKGITIPNSFSPNWDGIHDYWEIKNLAEYPGSKVEVYNRYGQLVFFSQGYSTPWDGTHKGSQVPFGTYYYIITLNNGYKPVTGSVTIVR
jgi:gliding motility-associated-like protein